MANLFLHVGMPKTGTSAIQSAIQLNKKTLEENSNILFITNRKAHIIAANLISNNPLRERMDVKALLANDFSKIQEEMSQFNGSDSDVFISSEYYVLAEKKSVLAFFSNYFDSITVIYTIRRQDFLLASGFNQDVKVLGRTSNLVWSYEKAKTFSYLDNFKEWESLGILVKAIDYDAEKDEKLGVMKALLSIMSDFDESLYDDLKPTPTANYSLSRDAVLLQLCANRMGVDIQSLLSEFNDFNKSPELFKLPPAYSAIIAGSYHDENSQVVREYFKDENSSQLCFPDIDFSPTTELNEAEFFWDPLRNISHLLEFFLDKCLKL